MLRLSRLAPLFLLAVAGRAAEPAPPLAGLTYSGDPQALVALDRDLGAAGTDPAKLASLEKRLLDLLRRSDTTFAARQALAQRLGTVLALGSAKPTGDAYKPLGLLLADERDSDLARLALEAAPGEVVDSLFVSALDKARGRTRLGLLDSIARRRSAAAVPSLARLLKDDDLAARDAAARALGEIADSAAVAALQATPEPSPAAIAAAKLAAAGRLPLADALRLLDDLQRNARDSVHRAAALRVSLDLDPANAANRIVEVLRGTNEPLKQTALEAVAASTAPQLVPTLAGKLASWDVSTQQAVLAAFARRRDPAALPAVLAAAAHTDADVRTAAVNALGFLPGTAETAGFLARLAAGDTDEAKAARQSLARLTGPDVAASILANAERGEPATRAVYLEQLALRNMTEGLPLLLRQRVDPSPVVRAAAVAALGDLAPASEQKALLDWTIEAADATEQTRALRALVNVTLRNPDVAERGRALYSLIEFAPPERALRLLPALGRIGGAPSAECAARLAIRDDARLAEAATAALVRWTDSSALPALVTVAETAALPAARATALDGAITQLERNRDAWKPESTTLVARLLGATTEPAPRAKLVALLHRANDAKALALVEGLKADATLAAAGAVAADVIRANLAGPARARASSSSGVGNLLDGKTSTRWTTPALGEEWVEIDFKLSRPLSRVTLDQTGRAAEFPERYEIHVTDDPKQPGKPLVSGAGQRTRTVIELPAGTRGRYLIIKNTAARPDTPWAICELYVD